MAARRQLSLSRDLTGSSVSGESAVIISVSFSIINVEPHGVIVPLPSL